MRVLSNSNGHDAQERRHRNSNDHDARERLNLLQGLFSKFGIARSFLLLENKFSIARKYEGWGLGTEISMQLRMACVARVLMSKNRDKYYNKYT